MKNKPISDLPVCMRSFISARRFNQHCQCSVRAFSFFFSFRSCFVDGDKRVHRLGKHATIYARLVRCHRSSCVRDTRRDTVPHVRSVNNEARRGSNDHQREISTPHCCYDRNAGHYPFAAQLLFFRARRGKKKTGCAEGFPRAPGREVDLRGTRKSTSRRRNSPVA